MLVCYRMKEARPPFISRYIIGEEVSEKGSTTGLENAIEVCEALVQSANGFQIIENSISNQMLSQGKLFIQKSEIEWEREVEEDHKLYSTWQKSINQHRLSLAGLVTPPDLQTNLKSINQGAKQ